MDTKTKFICKCILLALYVSLISMVICVNLAMSQEVDTQCLGTKEKWEQIHLELKDKLNSFIAIQQLPLERLNQSTLVSSPAGKTIAKQISEGLQAKEDVLNAHRKDCRHLMNLEDQLFSDLQACVSTSRAIKNKDFSSWQKKRRALLEKVQIALAEVKEVEGKETILPYSDAASPADPYSRSVNNYWQSYEQMYRRWRGY